MNLPAERHGSARRMIAAALVGALVFVSCGGGADVRDRLIIARNEGIFSLSLASHEETLLIANDQETLAANPAVSPDGTEFAYANFHLPFVTPGEQADLGADIFIASMDGSGSRLLVEHGSVNEQISAPAWFPDGGRLLYSVQRIIGTAVHTSIEAVDVASRQRTQVVSDGFRPAVSPDGSRIAFARQDDLLEETLWIADADGSNPVQVTSPDDGIGSIISPRFSPDGSRIAFAGSTLSDFQTDGGPSPRFASLAPPDASSGRSGALNGLPADIWIVDIDGGNLERLADLKLDQPSLTWSADGSRLFAYAGQGVDLIDPEDGSDRRVGEGSFHGQVDWIAPE